jgi:large subunit ribosomal protein L30
MSPAKDDGAKKTAKRTKKKATKATATSKKKSTTKKAKATKKAQAPTARAAKPQVSAKAAPAAAPGAEGAQRLRVRQVRSGIGRAAKLRLTLRALGIKYHQDEVVVTDSPAIRGMLNKVHHLVRVTPEES